MSAWRVLLERLLSAFAISPTTLPGVVGFRLSGTGIARLLDGGGERKAAGLERRGVVVQPAEAAVVVLDDQVIHSERIEKPKRLNVA
jgi:hypothetical protein